ncbi:MAG: hypothetical protein PUJ55_15320 [Clostridiales bacterium]|nr:hypothetical protein [Clostridiales bacterium]MDY4112374.1 hypothetical protein [Roseburia sp.]
MKKKRAVIWAIAFIVLLVCIKPAYAYYEYKQEEKRLSQEPYYTEYKLTRYELRVMANKYYVNETPSWRIDENMEDWPDYSYYTMEATEDTEMVVTVLNYWLFDDFSERDADGLKKAEEYGFSIENRISVAWVMSHPKEAVQIMESMWNYGDFFDDYQWIKREYENITGLSEVETEQMNEPKEQK